MMPQDAARRFRVAIVDDESLARRAIRAALARDPDVELVGEYAGGAEAVAAMRATHVDAAFLDIAMPECDGFDVVEMLGLAAPPALVFVTAHDAHAVRAFASGALDYLLKPFDDARFDQALARAKRRIVEARGTPRPRTIVVKSAGSIVLIRHDEIDWAEASDYYVRLHVGSRSYLVRRTLSDIERELDERLFCRVNPSALVRLDHVRGIELGENGAYEVRLRNGARVAVSRTYRDELRGRLGIARHSET